MRRNLLGRLAEYLGVTRQEVMRWTDKGIPADVTLEVAILDANVVIKLFELGCWARVVEKCDIHLSRIVVKQEAQFYRDAKSDERVEIDLSQDIAGDRIHVFDVGLTELQAFRGKFDLGLPGKARPRESESLAYLVGASQNHGICSADSIVYRILGRFPTRRPGDPPKSSCKRSAGSSRFPITIPGGSASTGPTRAQRR